MDSTSDGIPQTPPKVFISYSHDYRERVKEYVDRLITEGGIDVKFDLYDLDKGHDINTYMETMVSDPSIEFVLMFCNNKYMEKANARKGGVGTESLIISEKVYSDVVQRKFIPIACEVDEHGEFTLPNFIKSRNCFNFTTPEKSNEEWKDLVRFIHGKPQFQKPKIGKPPSYILNDGNGDFPELKYQLDVYKHSIQQNRMDSKVLLTSFFESCEREIDQLRVRAVPDPLVLSRSIIEKYTILKKIRNYFIEWLSFESNLANSDIATILVEFLERILLSKSRPSEMNSWNESWFDSHRLFLHDLFVYISATLLKNKRFDDLRFILTYKYVFPEGYGRYGDYFDEFPIYYGTSGIIGEELNPGEDRHFISPSAELFKRNADIASLPFDPNFMEAELLLFMASILMTESRWIPWSLVYSGFGRRPFPFFLKATKHDGFIALQKIIDIASVDELREAYKGKIEAMRLKASPHGRELAESAWSCANMDNLDML